MRSLALAKAPEGEGNTLDDLSADGESEPDEELVILLDNDSVAVDSDVLEPDKEVLVDSEIDAVVDIVFEIVERVDGDINAVALVSTASRRIPP